MKSSRPPTAGWSTTRVQRRGADRLRRAVRYHNAKWRRGQRLLRSAPTGPDRALPTSHRQPAGCATSRGRRRGVPHRPGARCARGSARTSSEPHQRFDRQIFWADLLSSEALAVNLFGDLRPTSRSGGPRRAHLVARRTGPGVQVRFYHSPGRFDPTCTPTASGPSTPCSCSTSTTAPAGRSRVDTTRRTGRSRTGRAPTPSHLPRFTEIRPIGRCARRSSVLSKSLLRADVARARAPALDARHCERPAGRGRYVVDPPEGNLDTVRCTNEYRQLLADGATFGSMTMERSARTAKVLTPVDHTAAAPPLHRQVVPSWTGLLAWVISSPNCRRNCRA